MLAGGGSRRKLALAHENTRKYFLLLLLLLMWGIQISLLIAPAAPDYVKSFWFCLDLSQRCCCVWRSRRGGVLHGRTTTLLRSRRKRPVETRGPNFERPGGPSLRPHTPYYTLVLGSFLPTCSKRQVSYLSGTFGGPFSGSLKNAKALEFRSLWRTFPGGSIRGDSYVLGNRLRVPQVRAHPMWSVLGYLGMPYSKGIYQA
jgi:hypothetical protein